MMITSRYWIILSLFTSLSWSAQADGRGTGTRPRPVRGSIAYPDGNHRRTAHWGGAVKVDTVPPHVTARTANGDASSDKKQPKGPKGSGTVAASNPNARQNGLDEIEEADVVDPTKGKAKKGKKGDASSTSASVGDCDDASDPECQTQASAVPSTSIPAEETTSPAGTQVVDTGRSSANSTSYVNGKRNGRKYGFGAAKNNATLTSAPVSAPTTAPQSTAIMHRSLTPFKLGYYLTTKLYEDDLDDGDYAELSDHTELFLTQYFMSYFAEEPTQFHDTIVSLQKTDNPLVVRLYITVNFVVPGNVPTMSNLFDRMKDAFAGEHVSEYVAILDDMGLGNPFRNTRSVLLVNDVPDTMANTESDETTDETSFKDNTAEFLTVVISSVVLFLVVVGLLWACQKSRASRDEPINQMNLDDVEQQDLATLKKQAFNNRKSRGANDANTRAYIQAVRHRYSDDGGSKTDREDISIEEEDEDGNSHTEANDDGQTLAELRAAVHMLDALTASGIEKPEPTYPSPPSDGNDSDNDNNGGNMKNMNQQQQGSTSNVQNKKEYMDYLDFQSSYDDDEDLRT